MGTEAKSRAEEMRGLGLATDAMKQIMIDNIAKLEDEQAADATQKAYCDKELAENTEKVERYKGKVEKITTRLDQRSSTSLRVKGEVSKLQEETAKMISVKNDLDNLRQKEKADYDNNKAEVSQSL